MSPTRRKAWSAFGLLMALAVGVALWSTSSGVDDPPHALPSRSSADEAPSGGGRPSLTITVTRPQRERWPVTLAANGSIAAWQEIVVGSEISGLRLTDVLVNVGDHVERGQLLARLSAETVEADRAQIRAALAEAQAMLAEASANAARARKLQASGAISEQQIAQYETAAKTAAARVEAQRASLQAQEVRIAHTRVVAPDGGIISARSATMGSVVQPGTELFRLIRGGRLEWRAEVIAIELPRVEPGQPARVTGADGSSIAGRVRVVAPTVDPRTRMGIVYVDLPDTPAARAGMFARGEIELGRSPALTVPQSAVTLRDGFSYVFRVDDDSRITQTKIQTGRRSGERIEVLDGLAADARVADSGVGFLADGDLVHVVEGTTR